MRRRPGPVSWFGGKGLFVDHLLPLPEHRTYVETWGGGAALLFAKPTSPVEVYNDLNSGLVNFFRVLQAPDKLEQLRFRMELTPYSRELFNEFRKTWMEPEDDVERAYRWFVVSRMSYAGQFGNAWASCKTESKCGMSASVSRYLLAVEGLPEFCKRLRCVQVDRMDFRHILRRYDHEECLFYCDPPYVHETRSMRGGYDHEMTREDHEEMVDLFLNLKGMVILSGYNHEVYAPLERSGWMREDVKTVSFSAREKPVRMESIWRNPACIRKGQLSLPHF
ncbi:MAG: DNA adenine methylase [Armatimonadetes bacterium]|nr:DNA adenine methylase [Armatimonadota bacterium]